MCILYVDISMSRYLDEVRSAECHMIGYPNTALPIYTAHPCPGAHTLYISRYLQMSVLSV